ncbi:MAG: acetylglutamate kinase [Armatimonadetes bacterium]|nr:acetylglutamate kinase [Armatimonadota bacterium]
MPDNTVVAGLRHAVGYLRLYRGLTFVVKCGGEAIADKEGARRLLEQVSVLHQLGIKVVLVHGGGVQATRLGQRLGATSTFIDGRRVTDAGMLECMVLALNGEARTLLLSVCRSIGVAAVGVSGIDAGLVVANRRPPTAKGDFGQVGDVVSVDPTILATLLDKGFMPVVSPLCADRDGDVLNVNADVVAAELAVAIGAAKLITVTSQRGILRDLKDESSLIAHLTLQELEELSADGTIDGGMLPKAASIRRALEGGVERVHVVGHCYPDSLLSEVFTNEGCGTLIVKSETDLTPGEA